MIIPNSSKYWLNLGADKLTGYIAALTASEMEQIAEGEQQLSLRRKREERGTSEPTDYDYALMDAATALERPAEYGNGSGLVASLEYLGLIREEYRPRLSHAVSTRVDQLRAEGAFSWEGIHETVQMQVAVADAAVDFLLATATDKVLDSSVRQLTAAWSGETL